MSTKNLYSEIVLNETVNNSINPQVQILRVGKFNHPQYGVFEITSQILADMKKHFDARTRGIDIAFDYFHESDKVAAGWPKELELREDNTELWATAVEWTPKAKQMLAEKELRYFSPDFAFEWTDPETSVKFSNVLFGGGLTNRPFVKGMEPIVSLAEALKAGVVSLASKFIKKGQSQDEILALAYAKTAELNTESNKGELQMDAKDKMIEELKAKVAELEAKLGKDEDSEMQLTMDKMKADNSKLCDESKALQAQVKELQSKIELKEKEAKFTVMLSEGKACVAQKEAYLSGNMEEFVAKAQPLNLAEKGSASNSSDAGLSEEDKNLKLAEEMSKSEKISFGEALSRVLKTKK